MSLHALRPTVPSHLHLSPQIQTIFSAVESSCLEITAGTIDCYHLSTRLPHTNTQRAKSGDGATCISLGSLTKIVLDGTLGF